MVQDDLESLIAKAKAEKSKRNFVSARHIVEKALQINPQRADLYELLGDLFYEVQDFNSAVNCYKKACEIDPQLTSAEEKMAEALLKLNSPPILKETPFFHKKPALASALSILLPGLGQVYNEQWLKGLFVAVGSLVAISYFIANYKRILISAQQIQNHLAQPDISIGQMLMIISSGILGLIIWTYGILDAYIIAKRFQNR